MKNFDPRGMEIIPRTKFKTEYCQMLITHMGLNGKTYRSFAWKIKVGVNTLKYWEQKHDDWREAKEIAEAGFIAYWEDKARRGATGKQKIDARMMKFMMINNIPDHYKEKIEHVSHAPPMIIIDTGIGGINKQLPDVQPEYRTLEEKNLSDNQKMENRLKELQFKGGYKKKIKLEDLVSPIESPLDNSLEFEEEKEPDYSGADEL